MRQLKTIMTLLLAIMLTAAPAYAGDIQIFGFRFGYPLELPECPYRRAATLPTKLYEILVPTTCYWDANQHSDFATPVKRIVFSEKEAPAIVKNWQMLALELNGRIAGIQFLTGGINTQEIVLAQLISKFGPPTSSSKRSIQNAYGAVFEAVDVSWKADDIIVTFEGVIDRIDFGRVRVETPAAVELRKSTGSKEQQQKRAL